MKRMDVPAARERPAKMGAPTTELSLCPLYLCNRIAFYHFQNTGQRAHMFTRIFNIAVTLSFLLLISSLPSHAQESRRAQPSFPIGSGEKMLVIPGEAFGSNAGSLSTSFATGTQINQPKYRIELPVGTVLKRLVVDVKDNDNSGLDYLNFRLWRIKNNETGTVVQMRYFNTATMNSPNFVQLVSNPLNHAMLQGWSYYVVVDVIYVISPSDNLVVGTVKVIYEP